jgi:hypothetical protein
MGKRNRNKSRAYLEKLCSVTLTQHEALEEANDKVITLKLEKMLLCDAYNHLVSEVTKKLGEVLENDEKAVAWLASNNIKKISVNKFGSDLVGLIQDYVVDEQISN